MVAGGGQRGWDAASAAGVSLGFTQASLYREQLAELPGLPTSPDEGKGSPGVGMGRKVGGGGCTLPP